MYFVGILLLSYKDFLTNELGTSYDIVHDKYRIDYEEYVDNCRKKESVTPIRYEYDTEKYEAGIHPSSHVHFGFGNETRVCTKKVWRPISFVLFIIRQFYPNEWRIFISRKVENKWSKNVRDYLDTSDHFFESELDKLEAFLL